ncbi:NADH-quinone oxidoreductase subunit G [Rhodoblastus sphagnicola]|uniref:NADH-quinone oxidoreductase n=1 Tax=Rhodoblastus sphagnicola TaxID=333368 RepID=A0A2S6N1R7_9HYPH|nr:NADH-quinone oxidoreductase subunit NuoG [Rhodoblastus sphagnicola]MBB4199165.1 NADH-quinone oxidoreductase subunit G [Rhodoblastus sphagnicola]PPQ28528.1 NADH-quinone oxidoreductase subunit G [Rhodoblastus sphagnicola]
MAKIIVDGIEVDVPPDYTLLQAAEAAGKEIPRFCFHERLSVAGNCRMCLVEVKGGPPKPTASCAMSVKDLRPGPNGEPPVMFTNSPMVKKAREGVMEFLLINHPLDCPICDQGGECDLQDQALAFGRDRSRYTENKNAVENKYIGPLVKTEMTRCIQCTRCVRFTAEICGTSDMGNINRGEDSEITTYLQTAMRSELQGNVTDLCPVGALLPRPQNFRARPWEYSKTPGVDVSDALGANIRIDARGREVVRILPRLNEAVNEEWISDKARQSVDGLKLQRLDRPYLRDNGKLRPASWSEAFNAIAAKVKATSSEKVGFIGGDLSSVEDLFAAKALAVALGVKNVDCRQDGAKIDPANGRASYLFNATVEGIDQADALLIIGSNPRWESPVLNARIRRRWRQGGSQGGDFPIAVIGEQHDLTYPYEHLGDSPDVLQNIVKGEGFGKILAKAERPLILIGAGVFARDDGPAIAALAAKLGVKGDWNGYCVLHNAASRVGALDIGFVPGQGGLNAPAMAKAGALDLLFLVGADEIAIEPGAFVVYVGTHGDRGAHRADVILPGAAYTEKSGLYVNTEGRVQMTDRAGFPPGDAREDWAIFRALSAVLDKTLPFDSLAQLRALLTRAVPHFAGIDQIEKGDAGALKLPAGDISAAALVSPITDFYLTNPISRASKVMAECSALAKSAALKQAAE